MHTAEPLLFTREDTMLGLCHGLAEELGLSPLPFRVALALALFWNPVAVILGYIIAATLMNLFRWLSPLHRASPATPLPLPTVHADNDDAMTATARAA